MAASIRGLRVSSSRIARPSFQAPAPPGAGLPPHRRAQYPPELRERFGGRRFIPADPPELLDHPSAELVLIGAAEDAARELGIELDAPLEDRELFERLSRPGAPAGARRG